MRAFTLEKGDRKLFAVLAEVKEDGEIFRRLIGGVRDILAKYDLHRGWFGTGTLLHSVTCHPGHPLEVIAAGLSQGNDWFTFSGYMDYLLQAQLAEWLGKVGLDVVTDVGTGKATHNFGSVAYGCRSWDGLKIQDMPTEEEWIRFVKERGGFVFRPVFSADCDPFEYDGYIAIEGNKKHIDPEDQPFILQTGLIREEAPAAMVLFAPKGGDWNREAMGRTNPFFVTFDWTRRQKRTLAVLNLPPAISVHKLLYGQSPEVLFPVSVHNFSDQASFPARVQVFDAMARPPHLKR